MSINKVIFTGNCTRDPELKATPSGMQVMNLGVCVSNRRKNAQTGQWEDEPCFVDCVMFGNRAEAVSRFLTKGAKVAIEGKLKWHQWQAQDGSKRSKLEVIIDELDIMQNRTVQQAEPELYADDCPF